MSFEITDHPILVVLLAVLIGAVGFGLLIAGVNRAVFPAEFAEVEQIRKDVQKVDPTKAEDVMGQAVEMNRRIVSMKQFNRMWWSDWAIPDAWNDVELIETETKDAK